MSEKLKCIMLIDDNPDDNFFHERTIKKSNAAYFVVVKKSGKEALAYLKAKKGNDIPHPDLIFLDVNMPGMNGWEFLAEYSRLDKLLQSRAIMIMLTTSHNQHDIAKANLSGVLSGFKTKPLTEKMLLEIKEKLFK